MNDLQLYINDQMVDLSDDHPIALTFQINNLADVQNQQGNTSNQFKLPLTQRNRRILGYPDDIAFCTPDPYTQYAAKLVQDGLEIIPYGIAELNGIDQDTAAITVLSGNVDFFDAIDGKIYDMGDSTTLWGPPQLWKPYDHYWTVANVAGSQLNTSGWIWPVVDYGTFTENFADPIDVRYQRPGFFVHTAVELLAKLAGYKINPDCFLLKQDLYQKLIVQFANDSFEHGTDFQNQTNTDGIYADNKTDVTVHYDKKNVNTRVNFTNVESGNGQWDGSRLTVQRAGKYTITVTIPKLVFYGYRKDHLDLFILQEGTVSSRPVSYGVDFGSNFVVIDRFADYGSEEFDKITLSAEVDMNEGDALTVYNQIFTNNPATMFIMAAGASVNITVDQKEVEYTQLVQCERIFPDISQKDFLKDILQRFGIVCQTDNAARTICFNSFRDIVQNIPLAKDWTAKCLDQGKSISFQLGDYSQVNYLRCKEDDGVLPNQFADDHIDIKDATLPATGDLFTSQFAPTLNRPYTGGTAAQILKVDQTSDSFDFSIGTQARLLVDQKVKVQSLKFTDGNTANDITIQNDVISVPYFYKPGGAYNLCFNDQPVTGSNKQPGLKTVYYPEIRKILTQTKKVVRYFILNPRDILELDLLIPVYLQQDNCYYYINKIDSWRKGQPTKVELVKLG